MSVVIGWRWSASLDGLVCFPAGTSVLTVRGSIPIEDVKVGDLVRTHSGEWHEVGETIKRPFDGMAIDLMTDKGYGFTATAQHPVLVRRGDYYYWMPACETEIGDVVFIAGQQSADKLDHCFGDSSIEGNIRNSDDFVSAAGQSPILSGVSIGSLMPVDSIDFQSNIQARQEKIDRIAINRSLLLKWLIQMSKTKTYILLWFSLFIGLSITLRRAITSRIHFIWTNAVRLAAFITLRQNGRASAFFGTITSRSSRALSSEPLPAAFAIDVDDIGSGALNAANSIPVRVGGWDAKRFAALWTNLRDLIFCNLQIAFSTAISARSMARIFELNATTFTDSRDTQVGGGVIASTTAITPIPLTCPRRRDLELSPALLTSKFDHAVIISRVAHHIQCEVYNLEVNCDHTYTANGIVVHNCAFCVAMMDGSIHPVDEEMIKHPNCRCSPAPVTQSWADLGIGDGDGETMQTGEEWLREQDQETQERILGKAGRAAWLDGRFELKDVIGVKEDDLLGEIGYRKSLIEILGEELADYYKRRVA